MNYMEKGFNYWFAQLLKISMKDKVLKGVCSLSVTVLKTVTGMELFIAEFYLEKFISIILTSLPSCSINISVV
jgi:hypothetical protein